MSFFGMAYRDYTQTPRVFIGLEIFWLKHFLDEAQREINVWADDLDKLISHFSRLVIQHFTV